MSMMTEWILVLTLLGSGSMSSGQAIEHITGFSSQEACADAGNLWLKEVSGSRSRAIAICIRRR